MIWKSYDTAYGCNSRRLKILFLNALDFGVPQKRERIVIVGFQDDVPFDFPEAIPDGEKKTLADILESNVDPKYYVRPAIRDARLAKLKDPEYPKPYVSHENMAGSITPRPYSAALRSGASANYILIDGRKLPNCPGSLMGACDDCGFSMAGEMYSVLRMKPDTILAGLQLRM